MNIKSYKIFILFSLLILFLNGCATGPNINAKKTFKHNTPLIKEDIRKVGKGEIEKTIRMGPKPVFGDTVLLNKRKKISSQTQRNYLIIPDDFKLLKQRVTFNFQNLDYKQTLRPLKGERKPTFRKPDAKRGEIDMELDNSAEVHLNEGDVLVQQGTNHSWWNRGKETCRLGIILIDAKSGTSFSISSKFQHLYGLLVVSCGDHKSIIKFSERC